MNKPFHVRKLNNGVVVEFFDHSNRYFGDYYRVKINAIATIPVMVDSLSEDLQKFAATCPEGIKYEKSLEQMGVATGEVQAVTESLIDNFITSVAGYLEGNNFSESLLRKQMNEKMTGSRFSP
ncbi:MAG: hypothetical protein GQ563_08365 [Desulfuromusa sp.]|nr:hypothetical protein [Desulfuromusa sp.]